VHLHHQSKKEPHKGRKCGGVLLRRKKEIWGGALDIQKGYLCKISSQRSQFHSWELWIPQGGPWGLHSSWAPHRAPILPDQATGLCKMLEAHGQLPTHLYFFEPCRHGPQIITEESCFIVNLPMEETMTCVHCEDRPESPLSWNVFPSPGRLYGSILLQSPGQLHTLAHTDYEH
jgi:hypothetical protein